jgi:hypothetical protein
VAAEWRTNNLQALRSLSWKQFRKELLAYFPLRMTRHQKLSMWRASAMRSSTLKAAQEFATEFQRLLLRLDPAPEQEIVTRQFIEGVRDLKFKAKLIEKVDDHTSWTDIRERVFKHYRIEEERTNNVAKSSKAANPATLESVAVAAFRRQASVPNAASKGTSAKAASPDRRRNARGRSASRGPAMCFGCGETGHSIRECPHPKLTPCGRCRTTGHLEEFCERYQRHLQFLEDLKKRNHSPGKMAAAAERPVGSA